MEQCAPRYARALQNPFAATAALSYLRRARKLSAPVREVAKQPVSVPVLSLQGKVDPIMPGQAFARDSHYVTRPLAQIAVEGAGHFLTEEAPEQVNGALLTYLQELGWPKGTGPQLGK